MGPGYPWDWNSYIYPTYEYVSNYSSPMDGLGIDVPRLSTKVRILKLALYSIDHPQIDGKVPPDSKYLGNHATLFFQADHENFHPHGIHSIRVHKTLHSIHIIASRRRSTVSG